ncbi:ankyrin repeat domain-containing protein [Chryseobacterium indologenes]|nr:ankyrin repeat domain-containing protein [Chryseobacterium indologenes]ATN04249.1 ankyrin repeat domain-containing protein [Chryseobacterium indologenes]AYY83088.1 ankyrin repeat domain-containing protein [Chryseobacterium indologenes]
MLENIKGMEVLLQKGADPNIITPDLFSSPVSQAVGTNNYEMLNVLLKYKAKLNPAIGVSPLSDAMLLGGEGRERKMIDYLLEHGADINHVSYDGGNIMENAARDDLKLAIYFLEKGGQPKIKGTELCPMARYIQFEEENQRKHNKTENLNEILAFKKQLIEKYNVQFNKNYGENLFQEDLKREKGT